MMLENVVNFFRKRKYLSFIIATLILTWLAFIDLIDGELYKLNDSLSRLSKVFDESLWPPDWTVFNIVEHGCVGPEAPWPLPPNFFCSKGFIGIIDTLEMAFVATGFGFLISLPLSILASRNLYDDQIAIPFRTILSVMRTLPSLIWAIFFVVMVGLGAMSGVFAMTLYTVGHLGKLQYESIEGLSKGPIDAARAMGLTNTEIVLKVIIPESANNLISQLFFMFEYNVRHGSIIGIVGGVGIGFYLAEYLDMQMYQRVMALLISLFIVVVIIDFLSIKARSYFVEEGAFNNKYLFGNIFRGK